MLPILSYDALTSRWLMTFFTAIDYPSLLFQMPSSPPIPPPPMALDEPLYTGNSESAATAVTTATAQKKGLLWQQRDKLFSRWKERYFVLTKDYFHCFKKNTSRVTEMGGFIFKVICYHLNFNLLAI